jgi:S-adenosylmethionine hydrolase
MAQIITLLTDFGTRDTYVGVMKGVITALCPSACIIDLTHDIPPQDLYAARFNLLTAVPYFPPDAVHVVVVDPGVGTSRRGIAVQTGQGILVGPDNGVMGGVLQAHPMQRGVALTNRAYWRRPDPSTTFHGRDIFAPAAAHLAGGVPLEQLGSALAADSLERLNLPSLVRADRSLGGTVQYIDQFGNGITTIPAEAVGTEPWGVTLGPVTLPWQRTYGEVGPGQPLALIGSHGWVEIAVNQGNARQQLGLQVGADVTLQWSP